MLHPAGIDHLGAGPEQEELAGGVLVAVRQRQEGQVDLLRAQRQRRQHVVGAAAVRQDRAVRQHHPLGRAAGAGGVDQAGQRVGGDRRRLGGDVVGVARVGDQRRPGGDGQRRVGRTAPCDQQVERAGQRHPLGQRGGRHHRHAGAGIAQDMGVVGHRVGGVGRHRHRPDGHQRGLDDRVFGPVLRHDHHPVARRHAGGAQRPRHARRPGGRIRPRSCRARRRRARRAASAGPASCARPVEHHRRQVRPLRQIRAGSHPHSDTPARSRAARAPCRRGPLTSPRITYVCRTTRWTGRNIRMPDSQCRAPPTGRAAELPSWDLRDLYPSPDSPEIARDLDRAEADARAFAAAHAGRLAAYSGAALAGAIADYERIEEVLGRRDVVRPVAVQRRFHRPGHRPLLSVHGRAGHRHLAPICCSSPWKSTGWRRRRWRRSSPTPRCALAALVARPPGIPPAPALRRAGETAAREGSDRPRRLVAPVRRNHRRHAHPLRGEDLTVSGALNLLSDNDRAPRGGGPRHRRGVRAQPPAVLADHQYARQGQGDRRPPPPPAPPPPRPRPCWRGCGSCRGADSAARCR